MASRKMKTSSVISSSESDDDSVSATSDSTADSESESSHTSSDEILRKSKTVVPLLDNLCDIGVEASSDEGGQASGAGARLVTTVTLEPTLSELGVNDTVVQYCGPDDSPFEASSVWVAVITSITKKGVKKGLLKVQCLLVYKDSDPVKPE